MLKTRLFPALCALVAGAAVFGSLTTACGPALQGLTGSKKSTPSAGTDSGNGQEKVNISVGVSKKAAASLELDGLDLADATSFQMTLDSCASGFTTTVTDADAANFQVYKFDQGCLTKLAQFVYNGNTYTPAAAKPFTTWQVGDAALFTAPGDPTGLSVIVVSQLSSPVSGTDSVQYSFSQVVAGATTNISQSVVGGAHTLKVSGQAAPAFSVASVTFTGLTATGAGQFGVTLQCVVAMTGAGTAELCKDLTLANIKYALVQDTYGGTPTLAQLQAVAASNTVDAAHALAAGTAGVTNGGFNSVTLTGPNQLHLNPKMILVLVGAGVSYQYFDVDVTTLTK